MTDNSLTITLSGPQGPDYQRLSDYLSRLADFRGGKIAVPADLPLFRAADLSFPGIAVGETVSTARLQELRDYASNYDALSIDSPDGTITEGSSPMNPARRFHLALIDEVLRHRGAGPEIPFAELAREIHASNVVAGWWTDLTSGESILATRNRPEMLMLASSELAEAAEGVCGDMDDKLPHLPMYDVELADFVIRQFDQIGAEVSLGAEMPDWEEPRLWHDLRTSLKAISRVERLMALNVALSAAMEHYRKGRLAPYLQRMADGVRTAFAIADIEGIDLLDIIAQKRAFNAVRADHKPENRAADDGKKF